MQETETLIVTVSDLSTANSVRSFLGKKSAKLWLYVIKNPTGEYNVFASNEWGGSLSQGMIDLLMNECNVFLNRSIVNVTSGSNDPGPITSCEIQP